MRIVFVMILLVVGNLSQATTSEAADKVLPITEAETVLAIYVEDWGLVSSGPPKMIMVIWGDGHAVWSENRIHGGAPYRSGNVNREEVAALIARLQQDGIFGNKELAQAQFGPDSRFTSMLIKAGTQNVKMQSWHELYEDDGKLVATKSGVKLLNGRRRYDVLAKEDSDYLHYRLVWAEVRALVTSLIPNVSAPQKGEVLMKAGRMSWRAEGNE